MDTKLVKSEFPMLRRLGTDIDRFFDRFGMDPFRFFDRPMLFGPTETAWMPDIEVFEREKELVLRADVPGLKREEITVEVGDMDVTIRGERKREKEEKTENFYRAERSYGSFVRTIPLPEGVKPEEAKAIVRDGVLEITMPLTKVEATKRRLEIAEEPAGEKPVKHAA